jgi:Tfp pilus assembly protein PilE
LQNQAKNTAFKHRFYNLFSDIFSGAVFKQAYRLGQLAFPQVGGCFTDKSANNNSIQSTRNVRSVGQYGRFLPICAKDTPHFWSDVYKVGTRARKAQVDLVQGGRSMIEMLGVLAIIGVLSVGGIAGYSKAMMKIKINKTVDLVSQLEANIKTLYKSQSSYEGLSEEVVQKAKLAPEEIFNGGSHSRADFMNDEFSGNTNMSNHFGGGVQIFPATKESNNGYDGKAFSIGLSDIPEDACIELATLDWGATTSAGLISVAVNIASGMALDSCSTSGETACNGDIMSVSDAATYCSGNNNRILWTFY